MDSFWFILGYFWLILWSCFEPTFWPFWPLYAGNYFKACLKKGPKLGPFGPFWATFLTLFLAGLLTGDVITLPEAVSKCPFWPFLGHFSGPFFGLFSGPILGLFLGTCFCWSMHDRIGKWPK
jgi:hypothetical protein